MIQLMAFDLLELVILHYRDLPDQLVALDDRIPEIAMDDIRLEHHFKEFDGSTVGAFLQFIHKRHNR